MREIKFRAWIKKKDGHWFMMWFCCPLMTDTKKYVFIPNIRCGNCGEDQYLEVPNEAIPMQYTGLKDKNGKEIYEGDILKFFEIAISKTPQQRQIRGADVIQSEGIGLVEWDDEGADYNLVNDGITIGIPRHEQIFIIMGNIHENPELLK